MVAPMRIKLLAVISAFLFCLPAYAQKTKSILQTEITTSFPDNVTGAITPSTVRGVFNDFVNSWQQFAGVNIQAVTTYTIQQSDYGQFLNFTSSSSIAVALPQASSLFSVFNFYIKAGGTGTLTITPTASTICGSSTLALTTGQSAWVVSDGTNYQCILYSVTSGSINGLTGDVTATGPGTVAATLATVNSNIGTFGSTTKCITATANGKGLITAISEATCAPAFTSITGTTTPTQIGAFPASHAALVDVAGTSTWKVVPDCQDTGGNHINYTQSSDSWSCGTSGGGGGGGRTVLTTTTTFYVNPSGTSANCNGSTCGGGSDTTGDGSLATPWATRTHAIGVLAKSYDLNQQQVTIQLADGTYSDSFQYFGSKLFGQGSPATLIFNGNATTPTNVLIQPSAAAGYTYGFFYGFSAQIQNQWLDQTNQFASPGQDILSVGQQSYMYLGNNVTFGCAYPGMGENAVSITTGGQLYFNGSNDYSINPSLCQAVTTSSFSASAGSIVVGSATGIHADMGITGAGLPPDAYVGSIVGTTVTLACVVTSPCQTSAPGTGVTIIVFGGGQFFLNAGTDGIVTAVTNNQSEFSSTITIAASAFYFDMMFANGLSNFNFQGITWIPTGSVQHGGCSEAVNISLVDTGLAGFPYEPCLSGPTSLTSTTATLTSGSSSFTVSGGAAALIKPGMRINGYAGPTGSWSAGSSTVVLSSATGSCIGGIISGPGILAGGGAKISNLVSTTATLTPCVASGRCVSNHATYLTEANVQLAVTGCGVPNGSWVTGVSGSTITINQPTNASGSQAVLFAVPGGSANYTGVQDSSVFH